MDCFRGASQEARHNARTLILAQIEPLESRTFLSATVLPTPAHVVVVVEEDHSYNEILGSPFPGIESFPTVLPSPLTQDPNIRQLASLGASMTNMHSVSHPNGITYQALFSGMIPRPDYIPPQPYTQPNIASELIAAGYSFGGYSESLPKTGYTGGDSGQYARQHNAWVDFGNVPKTDNLPFSKFPTDYTKLPTVSYVIPNADDNMHSGSVSNADNWLRQDLSNYVHWIWKHNSMLVITWDESHTSSDQIPTIFLGPMVTAGNYGQSLTQANVLSTLEEMYGLSPTGRSATAPPISNIFSTDGLTTQETLAARARRPDAEGTASISGRISPAPASSSAKAGAWWVYLDSNQDGQFEAGEPIVHSRHGRFNFSELAPGNYVVRVVPQNGYSLTSPSSAEVAVSVTQGAHVRGILFSETAIKG